MQRKYLFLLIVLLFIGMHTELFAQGCSQCKLLSEQGSELDENSFGSNINFGILYLMIVPYVLLLFLFRKRILGFLRSFVKSGS